jgi:hypothetical protein
VINKNTKILENYRLGFTFSPDKSLSSTRSGRRQRGFYEIIKTLLIPLVPTSLFKLRRVNRERYARHLLTCESSRLQRIAFKQLAQTA